MTWKVWTTPLLVNVAHTETGHTLKKINTNQAVCNRDKTMGCSMCNRDN